MQDVCLQSQLLTTLNIICTNTIFITDCTKSQTPKMMQIRSLLRKSTKSARDIDESKKEEEELKRVCKEAAAACLKEIHEHCIAYIEQHHEDGSYEGWIRECHPENPGRMCNTMRVDDQFYARDSDHRIIWNSYCEMQGRQEWKINFLAPKENELLSEKK